MINFKNLQLFAGVPPTEQQIVFDNHIIKVSIPNKGYEWTTSGQTITVIPNDGSPTSFEVTLEEGYILDQITTSGESASNITDTTFDAWACSTITLTSKLALTPKQTYEANMNALCEKIKALTGGSGCYTLSDMKNALNTYESTSPITLSTGDTITHPPVEVGKMAWFITKTSSYFNLYTTNFGFGKKGDYCYCITQSGTGLDGSSNYPYEYYRLSVSNPNGDWSYNGSGYSKVNIIGYPPIATNKDIYTWSSLSEKGSIYLAKTHD